jgi:hypothetical protein
VATSPSTLVTTNYSKTYRGYIKVTKIDPKKCKHGTLQNERNFGMKTKKSGKNDLKQGMKKPKVFLTR